MLVRAKKVGFYVKLRSVGSVFDVPPDYPLGSWMEPAKGEAKAETPEPPEPDAPEPEEQPKRRGRPRKDAAPV